MEQRMCWFDHLPAIDPWKDLASSFWALCFLALDLRSPHLTSGISVIFDSQLPTCFWLFCIICSLLRSRKALFTSSSHQLLRLLFSLSPYPGSLKSTALNNGVSPSSSLMSWHWSNANDYYYKFLFSEMLAVLLHSSCHLVFKNSTRRI